MRSNQSYPYKSVTASVGNNLAAITRMLRSVDASQIMTNQDEPAIAFVIKDKPFVIKQPILFFLERNGGDVEKSRRQGWSALRDYTKALVTRAQVNLTPWTAFAPHIQLQGATIMTLEEAAIERINNGDLKLLSSNTEGANE